MERHPVKTGLPNRIRQLWLLLPVSLIAGMSGCASLFAPIDAVPAELVPPQFLAAPQANKRPIDVSLLRHLPPPSYVLDKEDVLGIFVEGVLGKQDEAPPVTMPDRESDLSPGIGFPIPVRDDGTISLPLVEPIPVRGLTVAQTEELVKRRYEEEQILVRPRVTVTLLRKRTYRVFVVRQDGGVGGNDAQLGLAQRQRGVFDRSDLSSRGFVLQLPAYENDVLNALSQTGGLPGLNAKAEVTILRGDSARTEERLKQLRETYGSGMMNTPGFNPATIAGAESTVTIPLRVGPNEIPTFRPEDVILREGDVVYVESRETEVYYTGALLGGGEWPIPRDYDLDVLGAIAIAGRGIGFSSGLDRGLIGGGNQVPPTELIVLRKLPGNRQLPIRVDLVRATNDPQSRLLVHSGDTLLLRYKPEEELANLGISAFFTYGLSQLFSNN